MKRPARGTTLIELMVSLLIGSLLVVAVFIVMSTFEKSRRTLDYNAELDQTGNIAMYQLDQWIRSAGSGFTQASSFAYGCPVYAVSSGSQVLPATSLPAPFDKVSGNIGLWPALIVPTSAGLTSTTMSTVSPNASDMLILMGAGSDDGEVPSYFSAAATASQLTVVNSMAFAVNDLVLLVDQQPAPTGGIAPCMVAQIAGSFGGANGATAVPNVPLGGNRYSSTIGSLPITNFSVTGAAVDLGLAAPASGTATGQMPSFQIVGVGDNNTLYSYDLLNLTNPSLSPQARADGVYEMHALYGVDTDNDGKVDQWVSGGGTGNYSYATLTSGSLAAAGYLKNILAIRVGLILRSTVPEQKAVLASPSLTLFKDLQTGVQYTRTFTGNELLYHYRAVEATIPVRNNFF